MFTSRAEYRLMLRADNADERLTPRGISFGCVGPERRAVFKRRTTALANARDQVNSLSATPNALKNHGFSINQDGVRRSAFELLAYHEITVANLTAVWPELAALSPTIAERLEIEALYSGYVRRQEADVAAFRRDENLVLPLELDYSSIGGLSREAQDKLAIARPQTLGQAGRIPGVTPSALIALLRHVRSAGPEPTRSLKSA